MDKRVEISLELAEWLANKLEWDANQVMREKAKDLRSVIKEPVVERADVLILIDALKFYADRDHYSTDDGLNWDSCSGEPMNILWHESEPWFIEDGSIARSCLEKYEDFKK